jgi:O-acetyl-ADP-ribose deacetylase (regulator of RNase III)
VRVGNTTVEAVVGDLTAMETDAIVNAANSQL